MFWRFQGLLVEMIMFLHRGSLRPESGTNSIPRQNVMRASKLVLLLLFWKLTFYV